MLETARHQVHEVRECKKQAAKYADKKMPDDPKKSQNRELVKLQPGEFFRLLQVGKELFHRHDSNHKQGGWWQNPDPAAGNRTPEQQFLDWRNEMLNHLQEISAGEFWNEQKDKDGQFFAQRALQLIDTMPINENVKFGNQHEKSMEGLEKYRQEAKKLQSEMVAEIGKPLEKIKELTGSDAQEIGEWVHALEDLLHDLEHADIWNAEKLQIKKDPPLRDAVTATKNVLDDAIVLDSEDTDPVTYTKVKFHELPKLHEQLRKLEHDMRHALEHRQDEYAEYCKTPMNTTVRNLQEYSNTTIQHLQKHWKKWLTAVLATTGVTVGGPLLYRSFLSSPMAENPATKAPIEFGNGYAAKIEKDDIIFTVKPGIKCSIMLKVHGEKTWKHPYYDTPRSSVVTIPIPPEARGEAVHIAISYQTDPQVNFSEKMERTLQIPN